jgi:hypothetical protein
VVVVVVVVMVVMVVENEQTLPQHIAMRGEDCVPIHAEKVSLLHVAQRREVEQ